MALIKCIECGNQVSDKAKSCPECGCPVEPKKIEKKIVCFECGASISDKNETCPKCGVPLKEISKNKASKKEPINFFKAEKKNTRQTPKFDWKKDKRLIAFSYVFLGSSIFYFLSQVFAPAPQQNIRTPVFVPMPSQPKRIDPILQRSIDRRNQILNPSGVRCSQDLGLYGEPSINCQRY